MKVGRGTTTTFIHEAGNITHKLAHDYQGREGGSAVEDTKRSKKRLTKKINQSCNRLSERMLLKFCHWDCCNEKHLSKEK